jgi:hypothetical protein
VKVRYNERVHQLLIDFNIAYDSVSREVVYCILTGIGVAMNLVRMMKT